MGSRVSSFITLSRHQIYYLQLRVPASVRQNTHIQQTLIRKSLHTRHRGTAIKHARKLAVQMSDIYDQLEEVGYRLRVWKTKYNNYVTEGKPGAQSWYQEKLADELDRLGTNAILIREYFHFVTDEDIQLVAQAEPSLLSKARRILANDPSSLVRPDSDELMPQSLLDGNLRTLHSVATTQVLVHPTESPAPHLPHAGGGALEPPDPSETPLLDALKEEFIRDKIETGKKKKTIEDFKNRASLFVDCMQFLNGGRMPKTIDITPKMARDFSRLLKCYPKHINKRGDLKSKKRPEQLAYIASKDREQMLADGYKLISLTTVNLYFAVAKDLIGFGKKMAYKFQPDITSPIATIKKNGDEAARHPFSEEELIRIFESEDYKHARHYYASRYWTPLIALYSGATTSEILQLHISDVQQKNGIWYFDINQYDEKQLKNKKGRTRQVPIHHQLIELGFLDLVKNRSTGSDARLFPEENRNSSRDQFKNFSAWFNEKFKQKFGITSNDEVLKDFHSFRHTASSQLVGQGYERGLVNGVIGHTSGARDETERTYAKSGLLLEKKNEVLQELKYPINHTYSKLYTK